MNPPAPLRFPDVGPYETGGATDATDAWAAGDLISSTADLERFTRALFRGRIVRGPLLEEMFTLPEVTDVKTGKRAACSVGLSMKVLGGREVWGRTGGRWGYNAAVASTRDASRTLVYSVNSTDAKGQDMNRTAESLMVAAFGKPQGVGLRPVASPGRGPSGTR
ncbi:serine hydrolase [Streptomyces sp. NPDC101110]|uniref:serine hydrolase n=1 Tax=Streptomyces sp. NPDC101110 TaxID=3366104 RepID=UPI00382BC52C